MKAKLYISTLILVLSFAGIFHYKTSSPNQEIIVQFTVGEITQEQSSVAIADIKLQLQSLGVEAIQVQEAEDGKLKITYFSPVDIENIKKTLSEEDNLTVDDNFGGHDKLPSKKHSKNYNLDIYEIHQSTDGNQGSAGKPVWIVKQDYDRFFNPNVCLYSNEIDARETDRSVKLAYKINTTVAIAIDNSSHSIPEVRAGPNATFTS